MWLLNNSSVVVNAFQAINQLGVAEVCCCFCIVLAGFRIEAELNARISCPCQNKIQRVCGKMCEFINANRDPIHVSVGVP
jgi:hypothetical protein